MIGRCYGYGVYLFRAKNHRVWIKGKTLPVKKIHQKIKYNISLEKIPVPWRTKYNYVMVAKVYSESR